MCNVLKLLEIHWWLVVFCMRLAATAPWCCLGPVPRLCNVVRALAQFYNQNVSQTSGWRSWKYDFLVPLAIQVLKPFKNHTRICSPSDIHPIRFETDHPLPMTWGCSLCPSMGWQRCPSCPCSATCKNCLQLSTSTASWTGGKRKSWYVKRWTWICSQHPEMDWYTFP